MTGSDEAERLRRLLLMHARADFTSTPNCVDDHTIAALAEGSLDPEEHTDVMRHVAACARCRSMVASVARTLSDPAVAREIRAVEDQRRPTNAGRRIRRIGRIAAAAAAAVLLLLAWPQQVEEPQSHRAPSITRAPAPEAIRPVGSVAGASHLIWMSVSGADRYRVALFDAEGEVLYEIEGPDTVAALPDSVLPGPGETYWWRVEARLGFDRWTASDLIEFSVSQEAVP